MTARSLRLRSRSRASSARARPGRGGRCRRDRRGPRSRPDAGRLAFAFLSFASGAGIVAYLGLWALLPAPDATQPSRTRQVVGAILLVWAAILALQGLGLSDPFVWMLALVGAGVVIGTGATRFGLSAKGAQVAAIILIVAGVFVFVGDNAADRSVDFLPPGAVAVALLLIVAPWGWRLVRERNESAPRGSANRDERSWRHASTTPCFRR